MEDAVEAKLAANQARVYRWLPSGVLAKDTGPASEAGGSASRPAT
jgi:hypothetical protein